MLQAWARRLRERPISTNAAQGAVLASLGDASAQWLEARTAAARLEPLSFAPQRMLRAAAIGAAFSGCVYPPVYARLDAIWPGTAFGAVVRKSLAECALLGTLGNATSLLLRGLPASSVAESMPGVLLNEARVWLPYNLLAFRLIPIHVRPTSTACVTLGWHTYISWLANPANRAEPEVRL